MDSGLLSAPPPDEGDFPATLEDNSTDPTKHPSPLPQPVEDELREFLTAAAPPILHKIVLGELPGLSDEVSNKMEDFETISTLTAEVKEQSRLVVTRSIARISAYYKIEAVLDRLVTDITIYIFVFSLLLLPLLAAVIFDHPFRLADWPAWLICLIVLLGQVVLYIFNVPLDDGTGASILGISRELLSLLAPALLIIAIFQAEALLPFQIPFLTDGSRVVLLAVQVYLLYLLATLWLDTRSFSWIVYYLAVPVLVYTLYRGMVGWMAPILRQGLVTGLAACTIFLVISELAERANSLAKKRLLRNRLRRFPKEEIIESLVSILAKIQELPRDTKGRDLETEIISSLDWIAERIEKELFNSMPSYDPVTKEWLRQSTGKMAAAFRNLEQNILLPKQYEQDQQEVVAALSRHLEYAAEGNWGLFDVAEIPPAQPKVRQGLALAQKALPVVVLGAGILGLQFVPFAIDAEVRRTILATATLLLVGYVANLLDPTFESKAKSSQLLIEMAKARKSGNE